MVDLIGLDYAVLREIADSDCAHRHGGRDLGIFGLKTRLECAGYPMTSSEPYGVLVLRMHFYGETEKGLVVQFLDFNERGELSDERHFSEYHPEHSMSSVRTCSYIPYPDEYLNFLRRDIEMYNRLYGNLTKRLAVTGASGLHGWGIGEDFRDWLSKESLDLFLKSSNGIMAPKLVFDELTQQQKT